MKTKEEILWSFPQGESEPYGSVPVNRIYQAMDKYYNVAIQDAINVVNQYGGDNWKLVEPDLMAEDLQKKLESLKKKP